MLVYDIQTMFRQYPVPTGNIYFLHLYNKIHTLQECSAQLEQLDPFLYVPTSHTVKIIHVKLNIKTLIHNLSAKFTCFCQLLHLYKMLRGNKFSCQLAKTHGLPAFLYHLLVTISFILICEGIPDMCSQGSLGPLLLKSMPAFSRNVVAKGKSPFSPALNIWKGFLKIILKQSSCQASSFYLSVQYRCTQTVCQYQ